MLDAPYVNNAVMKIGSMGNSHKSFTGVIPRVVAEANGHFIAVITVTDGEHPQISSDGTGLHATIQVGDATYQYDGSAVTW